MFDDKDFVEHAQYLESDIAKAGLSDYLREKHRNMRDHAAGQGKTAQHLFCVDYCYYDDI